jgi:NADH dehydrogenase FAD-containing subunit
LKRRLAEREAQPWRYRDFGSLVSLGDYSTVDLIFDVSPHDYRARFRSTLLT